MSPIRRKLTYTTNNVSSSEKSAEHVTGHDMTFKVGKEGHGRLLKVALNLVGGAEPKQIIRRRQMVENTEMLALRCLGRCIILSPLFSSCQLVRCDLAFRRVRLHF